MVSTSLRKGNRVGIITSYRFQTFKDAPFRVQLEPILFNKLIEALNVPYLRFQIMTGNCDMIHCISINQRPSSIFTFSEKTKQEKKMLQKEILSATVWLLNNLEL